MIGQAIGMFAVTNIDDIVLLALFFGRAGRDRRAGRRVVVGQYLGFGAILALSVLAALGLGLLPSGATAYVGLVPIALGVKAAVDAWRARGRRHPDQVGSSRPLGVGEVTAITFANGGDNIGVYVPVFTTAGPARVGVYVVAFLVLLGVWCLIGRYLATRQVVARALARWGHVLLPVVLVAIGVAVLVEGGAFGL